MVRNDYVKTLKAIKAMAEEFEKEDFASTKDIYENINIQFARFRISDLLALV